ncbi:MAG: bifunctional folylpolyglutamate synthase/dihydrofolate synthase, partial [Lachnospiraceae bacterium]|nr:bifunctional folylpolyglutamate synthase/dihydrofolate synthase [Lachnospiraceae bacterium]
MTYKESLEYMSSLNKRGIHPGVEGIKLLCESLDNPFGKSEYIHVVGTNGKGSTTVFLSEILIAAGFKVGVFSSPAVFNERETIKVNRRPISQADYARLVDIISSKNTMGCTAFEVETALALMYFKERNCDYIILEAGMGGELDATNVIPNSKMTVITAIGFDHKQYLGNTLFDIANTKAGVIKPDSICVFTKQSEEAYKAIEERAKKVNANLLESDYLLAEKQKYKSDATFFNYKDLKNIEISLLGTFQVQNACLSIDAAKALGILDKYIYKGLKSAKEEGRFDKISDKPLFYLDGAHNPPAAVRLKESIETYFTKKKIIYIMGMLKDKDVESFAETMAPLADC